MVRTLQLLLVLLACLDLSACTPHSENVGVAVAYVGPHDQGPRCLTYSTQQFMEQVVREARRSGDCTFPAPMAVVVDSPAFYDSLDSLPNHEGVERVGHPESHLLFVVVTNAGTVLKRVRLEQGLPILDDLSHYASAADREQVRAEFIGPSGRLGPAAPAGSQDYDRKWLRMSSAHDRLMATTVGRDYEQQLIAVQNTFWQPLYARCSGDARKGGFTSFRAIAVINEHGLVTEFLPMPNDEHFACFVAGMLHQRYPAPPSAPFYERFTISLEN